MTAQAPTIYEQAVTTDRTAQTLARKHGFGFAGNFAENLPISARVLDVGAGASPLGRVVASLRPDITWVNFDYSYHDSATLDEISKDAPYNVQYVAGDATELAELYPEESFDAVVSYWLFGHLSLEDTAPALVTARAIYGLTKNGGLMSVGPKASKLPISPSRHAIRMKKDGTLDADSYAEEITRRTRLNKSARYIQRLANEVATPYFGTTRYAKRDGRIPKVFYPPTGEYVSSFSCKSLKVAGQLTVTAVRHARKSEKFERTIN